MAVYDVQWSAVLVATTANVAIGRVLVRNTSTAYYEIATSANRALYGRATGIATTAGDANNRSVQIQTNGICPPSVTGLGTGTASWVRVSTTGFLERCTPSGSDDVVGWAETDGSAHLWFGLITAAIANAAGGGVPGGVSGDVQVNSGGAFAGVSPGTSGNVLTSNGSAWTSAAAPSGFTAGGDLTGTSTLQTVVALYGATVPASGALTTGNVLQVTGIKTLAYGAVNLAGGANFVTGLLPLGNQAAPTGTGPVKVSAGAWVAAATKIALNDTTNDVTGTLGVVNGGTGLSALGTGLQVLRTNAGATAMEWATITATITGADTQVLFFDGANNPAGDADFTWDKTNNLLTVTAAYRAGGGTYATSGLLRSASNKDIVAARNAGNTADVVAVAVDGSDILKVGANAAGTRSAAQVTVAPVGAVNLSAGTSANVVISANNGTTVATASGTFLTMGVPIDLGANYIRATDGAGNQPTVGFYRFANDTSSNSIPIIATRRSSNTDNVLCLTFDGANNNLYLGGDVNFVGNQQPANIKYETSGGFHSFYIGSSSKFTVASDYVRAGEPITGDFGASVYGVHGRVDVPTGDANHTLAASEFAFTHIRFTGADTAVRTMTFTAPASNDLAYWKFLNNQCTGTNSLTISTGTGATATLTGGQAGWYSFDTAGVKLMLAATFAGW